MENEKILLHACCGICALEPTRIFLEEKKTFAIDYTNSNIAPKEEYDKRKDALINYVCRPNNIEFIEGEYDNEKWRTTAGCAISVVPIADHPNPNRCRLCYRQRFEEVAKHAKIHNFNSICTTLTISPYQLKDIIFEELKRAATPLNLKAKLIDFSPYYRQSNQRSKENGMYRQNYCGCLPSIKEAQKTRAKLKELRRIKKKQK